MTGSGAVINGTTQPGWTAAQPTIRISRTGSTAIVYGLTMSGPNEAITGLDIRNFRFAGITTCQYYPNLSPNPCATPPAASGTIS